MADAIRLEHVSVTRDGNTILDDITASVPKNSVTAVIGPNGAGKTTLLLAILGLVPREGRVIFEKPASRMRLGYVPQRLDFDRATPVTVLDFLAMSHQRRPLWFGHTRRAKELAMTNLRRVQAEHLLGRPLGKLSGGELQRVQLALALQADPDVVLLDEPVSGVDVSGERLFCDILESVHQESHLTLVMVSHDLSVVSRHATHVICLNQKLQCTGTAPEVLTADNLAAIYGPHAGLYDHHGSGGHGHLHESPCGHSHHAEGH